MEEEEPSRYVRAKTLQANLTRKYSNTTDEPDIQDEVSSAANEFISLFKAFRLREQSALREISSLPLREQKSVQATYIDLTLRTSGLPEVLLITYANSLLASTLSYEFYDFYHSILNHSKGEISKSDLVNIVETLAKPDRLGKSVMLTFLDYYNIRLDSVVSSLLQEGEAARRILNPETEASLFNKFKSDASDDRKRKLCSFKTVLPLMMALFIESEINEVLNYRVSLLSVLGASDSLKEFGPKKIHFNEILPFIKPVPKVTEQLIHLDELNESAMQSEGELEQEQAEQEVRLDLEEAEQGLQEKSGALGLLQHESYSHSSSLIKITIKELSVHSTLHAIEAASKELSGVIDVNRRILSYRSIQRILTELRVSGFSVRTT
jgi:hypothetical protein